MGGGGGGGASGCQVEGCGMICTLIRMFHIQAHTCRPKSSCMDGIGNVDV